MICISVTPESRQLAKVDIYNASNQCDLVEVCLDRLHKEPDVKDMISGSKMPVLISCRPPEEGGKFEGTEDERLALLRQAILAGPAYVELDPDSAMKIPRFGTTQRVVSFASMTRPLSDVEEVFDEATRCKADIVKFTWPTDTLEQAWPLLAVVSQKRMLPVVGLGLGRCGLTFSLLGRKYGSPWIYAALERGMEAFPGQPTVGELDDVYRWRQVDSKTRFIGIVGGGVIELAMAKILNAAFDLSGMNTRCLPLDFKSISQATKMLEILKIPAIIATPQTGRQIMAIADKGDDAATASQFSDVVIKTADGWQAHNLIWKSAVRALETKLGKQSADDRPLDKRNTMIVGSGGLAVAMAQAVKRRHGLVSICSADEVEAHKIAQTSDIRYVPVANLYETLADVVILTTNHLDSGSKKAALNPSLLRAGMTVMDLSEIPGESNLTQEARERGCKVVDPADVFGDYVGLLFKSLTGQELPAEAIISGLSE
ncbi:type I 3-dehydroquinate dehydratase [Schlesneria paludicola]|uniref:type I 3-dehydroquinate dehydratase n=1 Tax=Schlesneria paludicola TaxID=360056 RepID=UPI00029A8187|nr:type I 3-dehydroquinate dehydratase [Schlesneria paludicola]